MQKIIPTLWYNFDAEEAVDFYMSVFKDGRIINKSYYTESVTHVPPGTLLTVDFEILGMKFIALNGGPEFPFTDAVSLMIDCKDQREIDYYWDAFLSNGGRAEQCGWLRDKYGLAWQVTPRKLDDMLRDPNRKKADAAMKAMMQMIKIDIAKLQKAFDNA